MGEMKGNNRSKLVTSLIKVEGKNNWVDGWMDGFDRHMDEWMEGECVNGWKDGWE